MTARVLVLRTHSYGLQFCNLPRNTHVSVYRWLSLACGRAFPPWSELCMPTGTRMDAVHTSAHPSLDGLSPPCLPGETVLCGHEASSPQGFTVYALHCCRVMCLCWKQNSHDGLLSQMLGKYGIDFFSFFFSLSICCFFLKKKN